MIDIDTFTYDNYIFLRSFLCILEIGFDAENGLYMKRINRQHKMINCGLKDNSILSAALQCVKFFLEIATFVIQFLFKMLISKLYCPKFTINGEKTL